MDIAVMSHIHSVAFAPARGWSAAEIKSLSQAPGGFVVTSTDGFALGRAVAGEAELLTIAVDPAAQGRGQGRLLLAAFEARARGGGADVLFLDVAEDNLPARALYEAAGWQDAGRRRGYYAAGAVDALLLRKVFAGALPPDPQGI